MDAFVANFNFSINYPDQQDQYDLQYSQSGFSHTGYWNQEEPIYGKPNYVPVSPC